MAHVKVPEGAPGIVGLLNGYPETGDLLRGLADALLRSAVSLSPAERELIATHVSAGNGCRFCTQSHAAAARALYGAEAGVVDAVVAREPAPAVGPRMQALLALAEKVRVGGRGVAAADVEAARKAGADDRGVHDTVLIAAAFCMFNRYVDGLGTFAPEAPAAYVEMGRMLAAQGYRR